MNIQPNSNFQYHAEAILRYLNGQMAREEVRIFERAMLDDDMLSEAVEGFLLLKGKISDHEILERIKKLNINSSISPSLNDNQLVRGKIIKRLSYGIAASILVAAGWWLYSVSKPGLVLPMDATNNELLVSPVEGTTQNEMAEAPDQTAIIESPAEKEASNKQLPTGKKGNKEEVSKPQSPKKEKDSPNNLNEKPGVPAQIMTASAEEMDLPVKESATKRMAPSAVEEKMNFRITWQQSDSVLVSPQNGWNEYRNFLSEQIGPFKPIEIAAKATLTIDEKGKIIEIKLEAPITSEEKRKLGEAIIKGPSWINHTGKKQETTIQWQ